MRFLSIKTLKCLWWRLNNLCYAGPRGPPGDTGATGETGFIGLPGAKGATGPQAQLAYMVQLECQDPVLKDHRD